MTRFLVFTVLSVGLSLLVSWLADLHGMQVAVVAPLGIAFGWVGSRDA